MPIEVTKAISKALTPLVGGASKELSGYLADHIRFLRWKSAVRILERAKEFCGKRKLDPKSVPIKFIVPFLESASLEDVDQDETLSKMWSALFISAATAYQARHAVYVDVLKKLSVSDAEFVASLYEKIKRNDSYWDDEPFDADLANVNDKQDVIHLFEERFAKFAAKLLDDPNSIERFAVADQLSLEKCFEAPSWRVDIVPLRYDLSLYNCGELDAATTAPFRLHRKNLDTIANLAAFNLMERVEIVSWYPIRSPREAFAIRATCSFALLTSLGFDFVISCGNVNPTRKRAAPKAASKARKTRR
jgi:hypothetical protein